MSRARWRECSGSSVYRNMFVEEARVDRCSGRVFPRQDVQHSCLAGTELARLLRWFGLRHRHGCGCRRHAALMDRRGCDWCERNIELIVDWMEEEAGKRRLPFMRAGARRLARLAIRRARKKQEVAG